MLFSFTPNPAQYRGRCESCQVVIFTNGARSFEHPPPTKEALLEHIKRAVYQASHVWNQCLVSQQVALNPGSWGWEATDSLWKPFWTPIPSAVKGIKELTSCGCQKKSSLPCMARCGCAGTCFRPQ